MPNRLAFGRFTESWGLNSGSLQEAIDSQWFRAMARVTRVSCALLLSLRGIAVLRCCFLTALRYALALQAAKLHLNKYLLEYAITFTEPVRILKKNADGVVQCTWDLKKISVLNCFSVILVEIIVIIILESTF